MRVARGLLVPLYALLVPLIWGGSTAGDAQIEARPPATAGDRQSVTAPSPNLAGLAHVALRVEDLDASIRFYERLGFVKAFVLSREGKVYEAFIKVNDRQFIELYPVTEANPGPGFLHVCFEAENLQSVHDFYVSAGLSPTPVKLAGAGNLLFTMPGPATPNGPQNMEYTQYRPGSLHTNDAGKHLGPERIAAKLTGAALAVNDPKAARLFYVEKAGFSEGPGGSVQLPGAGQASLEIVSSEVLGARARIFFPVNDLAAAQAVLAERSVPYRKQGQSIVVLDPDRNEIVLTR
jgi:catechol 2,3-dioxygenase-like lactoylglutathione lyase family enzyme